MKKLNGMETIDFPEDGFKSMEVTTAVAERRAIGWGLLVMLFLFTCVGTFIVTALANRPNKPLASLQPIVTAVITPFVTQTSLPTATAAPSQTPLPTYTPFPTQTSLPTSTALPSQTPLPTYTPFPVSISSLSQTAHLSTKGGQLGLVGFLSGSVVIACVVLGVMVSRRNKHENSPVVIVPASPPSLPMPPTTTNLPLGANSPRTYTPNLVEVYLGGSGAGSGGSSGGSRNGSERRTGSGGGSKNGSSGSSGSSGVGEGLRVRFPLPISRPPTGIEREAIRALLATGQSMTAVTRKVYGFKNGKSYGYVRSVLGDEG